MVKKMISSIGNKKSNRKAYTFIELMVTISILSIGIIGVYRSLLISLDYQAEISHRLFALNVLEHQIALRENQYQQKGEISGTINGEVIEAVLDNKTIPFTFTVVAGSIQNIDGLLPLEVTLSWPDRGRTISLNRVLYFFNPNTNPVADAVFAP